MKEWQEVVKKVQKHNKPSFNEVVPAGQALDAAEEDSVVLVDAVRECVPMHLDSHDEIVEILFRFLSSIGKVLMI